MNKSEVKIILVSVFLSVLLILGYHFFFIQKKVQRIKVFDLTGYVSVLRELYLKNKIDDKELAFYLQKIRGVLNSQPEGVVILPVAVVLNKERLEKIKLKDRKLKSLLKDLEKKEGGKNEK